jgi:hypothetical protein
MNTYIFRSTWFTDYDKFFKDRGNWRPYDKKRDGNKVDYIYVDGDYIAGHPEIHSLKGRIKNQLAKGKYNIADKGLLYINMEKYNAKFCEKYMMKQYYITLQDYGKVIPKNVYDGGRVWILKPIAGYGGIGINIFTNYDEMDRYMKSSHPDIKKDWFKSKNWVLAEYINNPLLFMDRKFHIRVYLLYFVKKESNGSYTTKGYIMKKGKLFPGRKPYVNGEYEDKDIHDTHYFEDIGFYMFPEDFVPVYGEDKWNYVFEQILDLGHVLTKLLKGARGYPETVDNYEVLALDVMILDNFQIKLLEVNPKVGYACEEEGKCDIFNDYFLQSQFEIALDPFIPPKNKPEPVGGYIDVTDRVVKMDGGYYDKYIKYKNRYTQAKLNN